MRYTALFAALVFTACGGETITDLKNEAPTAVINAPVSASGGEVLDLDGKGSSDLDGTVVGWAWDFGDGATAQGESVQHIYNAGGTFVVTLTVTDNLGATGKATASLIIDTNSAPTAAIVGPSSGQVGETLAYDGSSSSDSDGSLVRYEWDFGDTNTAAGPATTNSFAAAGSYELSLTVFDDGGASNTARQTVTIDAAPAGYSGRWEWHLTDESLRTDTCGTFQDSQLDIAVTGSSISVSELAGGSVVQTYTGSLVGLQFQVTYTDSLGIGQTITGTFSGPTAFTGIYSINTGGLLNCVDKPVAGSKL